MKICGYYIHCIYPHCRFCGTPLTNNITFDPYHDCLRCIACDTHIPYADLTYRYDVWHETNRYQDGTANRVMYHSTLHWRENIDLQAEWKRMGLESIAFTG